MGDIDLKIVAENYGKMSDDELISVATTRANGLRPEVFEIIENEIKKRNLNLNLLKGAEAQNKDYTKDEVEIYSRLLRDLPCPICGSGQHQLNASVSYKLMAILIFEILEKDVLVACPKCLDRHNNKGLIVTVLFGWWGIPAIFKTPICIYRNFKAKKDNKLPNASETLSAFTLGNIGLIETYKDNRKELVEIIKPRRN